MKCADCSLLLRVIAYRFGESRVCFLCAIARMKKKEFPHQ